MELSKKSSIRQEIGMIYREFQLCLQALNITIELSKLGSRDHGHDVISLAENDPHLQDTIIQLQRLCEIAEALVLVLHEDRNPTRIHESCVVAASHHSYTRTSTTPENEESFQNCHSEQQLIDPEREQSSTYPMVPVVSQGPSLLRVHRLSPQMIPAAPYDDKFSPYEFSPNDAPSAGAVRGIPSTQPSIICLQPLDQYAHCKILVVDDNAINQRIMFKFLQKLGLYNVIMAGDGQIAVERVQESMDNLQSFDLIFMDDAMPVLSGQEATRQIRDIGYCGPICGMVANATPNNKQRVLDAGMDTIINKPFRLHDIRETLERYLFPISQQPENHTPLELDEKPLLPRQKPAVKSRL
jgi:CheY-like chemotaxis protein